ncbi:MAG: peptidoglycan-binding protein [Acidimicrobiales bacterium]
MAEYSAKRVVAIAALAGALVGGAVAGAVAMVTTRGNDNSAAPSLGGSSPIATAQVVRTNLSTAVQVGGSIGYDGFYTVVFPSGSSAQQVAQAQQTVTEDQQTLSADEQAETGAASADNETIAADETNVNTGRSTLGADKAAKTKDCTGTGASSVACSQELLKVSQDEIEVTQAKQQLIAAKSSATVDHDENQAKVASDKTRLQGDQAALASLQTTAVNPGTTYTWLPEVGAVIKQNQPVYSLSNEPAPLLYGSISAYRAFYVGMSDGPDVGELTHDLIALGYGGGLTQSSHYSTVTAAAVERWQRALGLPATGDILLGDIVFEPAAIRITSVTPSVGQSVGSGSAGGGIVLTATGTTPIITVDLDVSEEYLVKPGEAVSVVLPDGTSIVGGHIETVGNVATCPGGSGIGTGSSSANQSPCSSIGTNSNATPTVAVTITLDRIPPGATLDQAPVNVNITTQQVDDVLAVPVNALLALQGGGFGVEVVTGNTTHLVGVTTGLYSNTLVQVSGSGLTAGTQVEVPSS